MARTRKPAETRPHSTARLREAGYTLVQLWLSPEDRDILRAAADAARRPLTQFLIHHGIAAARKGAKKNPE